MKVIKLFFLKVRVPKSTDLKVKVKESGCMKVKVLKVNNDVFLMLGKIIGANLSSNCAGGNLSKIFDCIASKRGWSTPVHISDSFSDITAIVTHARSLASITVNSSYQIMLKYTDSLKSTHDPFMITCNHDSLPMPAHSKKISRCKTSDHDY